MSSTAVISNSQNADKLPVRLNYSEKVPINSMKEIMRKALNDKLAGNIRDDITLIPSFDIPFLISE